jgi:arabinose-5-phosphate isomerase
MTTVLEGETLAGIISDGDIRRALQRAQRLGSNPLSLTALDILTANPVCTLAETLAVEAAKSMETRKITFVVVKEGERPCGIIHIHDLFAAKVI